MPDLRLSSKAGDLGRARLRVVHDRDLELVVEHLEAERLRHVAEHRLGGGHRRSRISPSAHRPRFPCRSARRTCSKAARLALNSAASAGSTFASSLAASAVGEGGQGLGIVPKVRVVAALGADEVGRHDGAFAAASWTRPRGACPSRDRSRPRCRSTMAAPRQAPWRSRGWSRTGADPRRGSTGCSSPRHGSRRSGGRHRRRSFRLRRSSRSGKRRPKPEPRRGRRA